MVSDSTVVEKKVVKVILFPSPSLALTLTLQGSATFSATNKPGALGGNIYQSFLADGLCGRETEEKNMNE